jgi:hypothetical protein
MQTLQQLQSGGLNGISILRLHEGLSEFPEEIFELADTLEMLDLSGNNLSALPPHFGRLKKLRILFCNGNQFTELPKVLGDCPLLYLAGFKNNQIAHLPAESLNPNLRWLILTNNRVAALPPQIGNCTRLQKLMLAGNQLQELPVQLSQCQNLELLRISANQLKQLPGWLLTMPKLAWLAFSGNPFSPKPVVKQLDRVHWDSLEIGHLLGEGASGIIHKAKHTRGNSTKEVAVKVFKGTITSDGFPEDELYASINAGSHPGLIPLMGHIEAHPEGKTGLVMGLIAPSFYNLGNPPDLDSCTRDVFSKDRAFTAQQVLRIAGTIASVAVQLHSNGIMHSDLYAHNILVDNNGNALLGDFGAACFYDTYDHELAHLLQRLEVRAYGCLLDDLLGLCSDPADHPAMNELRLLRDACWAADVAARPDFKDIVDLLPKL